MHEELEEMRKQVQKIENESKSKDQIMEKLNQEISQKVKNQGSQMETQFQQ